MRLSLLVLTSAFVLARANDPAFHKHVDSGFIEKQRKVLDILNGISVHNLDSKYEHEHQDVTFNNAELFTDPKPLEEFLRGYKRGMIPRDGIFTLNNYKSRHDTFSLFEIMFFAKDFDTFIDIAKWAKNELNSMQFAYAFSVAVMHRADCRGMYLPPNYELYPHNFVPSEIMRQADIAALKGVEHRVFEVNNTGFEHSFYRDMTSGASKDHPRWVGDDVESRLSYFREDPGVGHWYAATMAGLATWLSPTRHPGIHFAKRGEGLYRLHTWLLSRYNLERISANVPFVVPFDWDKPVIGYNPRLSDSMGRPFVSRPDNVIPFKANPTGFQYLSLVQDRIHESIDSKYFWDFKKNTGVSWVKDEGADLLGKLLFGERDGIGRYYYKPWFFLLQEAINDMIHSTNERDFTNTVFGKYMTMPRDPLFYQVLAALDSLFQIYTESLDPYTPEELGFPGVKLQEVEFDKFTTYFERWEFDITQGVVFKNPEDRGKAKYLVSQPRLNHRPFHFNVTVQSDKAQDAMLRILFGPKNNIDSNEMSLNQARHAYALALAIPIKLKEGVNVISRRSDNFFYHESYEPLKEFKERMNKADKAGKPLHVNALNNCGLPVNLMLPRGSSSGKEFNVFIFVEPSNSAKADDDDKHYHCNFRPKYMTQRQISFPFDRPINYPNEFLQPNMMFKSVKIYHKSDLDFNSYESR